MKTSSSFVQGIVIFVSIQSVYITSSLPSLIQVIYSDYQFDKFGCYYRKDLMKMNCHQGDRIAFKEVIYGTSVENCTEESTKITCSQNETDCLTYDKFKSFMKNDQVQKCSGNRMCSFQTTWDQISLNDTCQNKSRYPCYLIVKGECIYEEDEIDFCKNQEISGTRIYIHNPNFPRFDKSRHNYECDCTVKSGETLNLYVITLALDFKSNNICSSNLRIYNDKFNNIFSCNAQKFQESINIPDSNVINLKLTKKESWNASQIWMRISSTNNERVTVKCEKKKYLGTSPSENFEKIKIKADQQKMSDFWLEVKIICGAIGGLAIITLIIIGVITYRRYTNIVKQKSSKKSSKDGT